MTIAVFKYITATENTEDAETIMVCKVAACPTILIVILNAARRAKSKNLFELVIARPAGPRQSSMHPLPQTRVNTD